MTTKKTFEVRKLSRQILVTARENDCETGELVSLCQYRKRYTKPQRDYEIRKWERLGYTLETDTSGEAS
jgi:hypothetical protein